MFVFVFTGKSLMFIPQFDLQNINQEIQVLQIMKALFQFNRNSS